MLWTKPPRSRSDLMDALVRAVERAVNHKHIRYIRRSVAANGNAVAGAIDIVGDKDIRRTTAAGEVVVTHADVVIDDEDVSAAHVIGVGIMAGGQRVARRW